MYRLMLLCAAILFSHAALPDETESTFCDQFSGKNEQQITERFLNEIGNFEYDSFFYLLEKIRKGDKNCFRVGVILGENSYQFGVNVVDIIEVFGKLVEQDPKVFYMYSSLYSMSDELFENIMSIPEWKIAQMKVKEIIESIKLRKKYIHRFTKDSDPDQINRIKESYEEVLLRLENYSRNKLELFHENGMRLVYESNKPDLISDKRYSLSNLVDDDPATAWCTPEAKDDDLILFGTFYISFYLDDLQIENYNCREGSGRSGYECYIEKVVLRIRPGYQKNEITFINNSRPRIMTGDIRFRNYEGKYFYGENKYHEFREKLEIVVIAFPVKQWVPAGSYPINIAIRFESITKGDKYAEMCISDMMFDLMSRPTVLAP